MGKKPKGSPFRPPVTVGRVGKELPLDQCGTPIFEPRNRRERRALESIERKKKQEDPGDGSFPTELKISSVD